jgi:hypothetical protein
MTIRVGQQNKIYKVKKNSRNINRIYVGNSLVHGPSDTYSYSETALTISTSTWQSQTVYSATIPTFTNLMIRELNSNGDLESCDGLITAYTFQQLPFSIGRLVGDYFYSRCVQISQTSTFSVAGIMKLKCFQYPLDKQLQNGTFYADIIKFKELDVATSGFVGNKIMNCDLYLTDYPTRYSQFKIKYENGIPTKISLLNNIRDNGGITHSGGSTLTRSSTTFSGQTVYYATIPSGTALTIRVLDSSNDPASYGGRTYGTTSAATEFGITKATASGFYWTRNFNISENSSGDITSTGSNSLRIQNDMYNPSGTPLKQEVVYAEIIRRYGSSSPMLGDLYFTPYPTKYSQMKIFYNNTPQVVQLLNNNWSE